MRHPAPYLILLLTLFATPLSAHERGAEKLRVMTQNLYVGADMTHIIEATTPEQIPLLVGQAFATINATDFPARAEGFVEQVRDMRPDVIGLQEVSLIRYQEQSDFFVGNPQQATQVLYDYLQIVLDELAAAGLHYKVAGVVTNVDQELPAYGTLPGASTPGLYDVRLTDRDVVLVRKGVEVGEVQPITYTYNLIYPSVAGDITYLRGAIALRARVDGEEYRVINTHLEVRYDDQVAIMQSIQMQELLGLFAGETLPVVLLGDFNSSPVHTPDTLAGLPTPYQQTQLAGYTDTWLLGGKGEGYTCCHTETVNDLNDVLYERIDHVFVKAAATTPDFAVAGKARDHTFSEVTDNGLWHSDHDGLYSVLKFPQVQVARGHGRPERHDGRRDRDHH